MQIIHMKSKQQEMHFIGFLTGLGLLPLLCLVCLSGFPQKTIQPYPLEIGFAKTTSLLFPYPIITVDRGSLDILAQRNKGNDHILLVKARQEHFVPSNLTVVTSEGKCYCFLVSFSSDPPKLAISFEDDTARPQPAFMNHWVKDGQIKLRLTSIYIDKQLLWFHFDISNQSFIDYIPDYIRFFLEDKQKSNRTARQERELLPAFRLSVPTIPGHTKRSIAFAFHQFTFPQGEHMICECSEQDGGRLLRLPIPKRVLLKARVPPR